MKFLLLRDGNPSKEDKKPVFTSDFFPIESFKEKSIIQKLSFIFSSGNEHSMLNTMKETNLTINSEKNNIISRKDHRFRKKNR